MNRNGNVPAVRRRTLITGVAAFSPFGITSEAFRDHLLAGATGIRPIEHFDCTGFRSVCAAELRGFDPAAFIPPMKLRRMDAVGSLAVAATGILLAAAGLETGGAGHDEVGVVLGTCTCGVHATGEFLDRMIELGPGGAPAMLFSNTVGNAAASLVGLEYRLRGPNTTVSYKEASGAAALALAVDLVRAGKARALVTGGVEDIYDLYFKVHDWFGVLSRAGSHPEGARPFDATRNGFVMGEGAYLLVVEDEVSARGRGAPVLAEITGIGAAASLTPVNAWPDDPRPLARCVADAIADAGLRPADIGAVYASANGSPHFDAVEAEALQLTFGGAPVPVTSVKGAIGEGGMAAAGSVVAAVLCGADGLVPPAVGLHEPAGELDALTLVCGEPRALRSPHVLVTSFASGGTCYAIVLRVPADDLRRTL
jgi:3-oxoacyl-[acyl-carrier-protein] synthase II